MVDNRRSKFLSSARYHNNVAISLGNEESVPTDSELMENPMAKGKGKGGMAKSIDLELETTTVDPSFALFGPGPAASPEYSALIAKLGFTPTDTFDFAYVSTSAKPTKIKIGDTLEDSNGLIFTGNGMDEVDLSKSTGNNLVYTGNGNDKVKGGDGNDTVYGGNGTDELRGEDGDDTLYGENGNDLLRGGKGNDKLYGGNGNDELRGEDGNDQLFGGAGADKLKGGEDDGIFSFIGLPGAEVLSITIGDVLTGGSGPDRFRYELGLLESDGVDQITDFVVGQDKLELQGVTLAQLKSMTDGTNLYIGFDDGVGGWRANSAIKIDGATDINLLLAQQSIVFVV